MSRVEVSIQISAPPEAVWDIALDPSRLKDWVTIHSQLHEAPKRALRKGDEIDQTLTLRGLPFRVCWKVAAIDRPNSALWEGSGPAGSKATTEYRLEADGDGTLFSYANEFKPPAGLIGRMAAGALVGDLPEREARESLKTLQALCEADR